jgi:RHS repeat-associated protein
MVRILFSEFRYWSFAAAVLSVWFFFSLNPAFAQAPSMDPTLERGMKPYGSFEGGAIDSVSMTNGDLNLHIPLVSYPQRGGKLSLGFFVRYQNGGYTTTPNTIPACTTPPRACDYGTNPSGSGPLVQIESNLDLALFPSAAVPPSAGPYASLTTPDGSMHEMGAVSGGWRTVDASGFLCLNNCATLTDRSGIRYSQFLGGKAQKIEDPNGNFITAASTPSGNVTSYQDTMGRTLPFPPSFGVGGAGFTSDTSGCTGTLPTLNAYLWALPGYQGGQMTYKICYANVYYGYQTCTQQGPGVVNCGVFLSNVPVIQSIVLPNQTAWTFQYDSANPNNPNSTASGNLLQVTFPTGGFISYSWHGIYTCQAPSPTTSTKYTYALVGRGVNANDGAGLHVWSYSIPNVGQNVTYSTTVTDPLGQKTVHTMGPVGGICAYYEKKTETYDSAGNLLHTVSNDYAGNVDPMFAGISNTGSSNVVPIRATTVWPNGQTSKTETDYDSGTTLTGAQSGLPLIYGTPIARREYDYGNGAPGSLLRTTSTAYQAFSNSAYLSNNLLDLPSSVTMTDSLGATKSMTNYLYDQSTLTASGVTMQLDAAPPDGSSRGNPTTIQRWLNLPSSTFLSTTIKFFDTGTVNQVTDPLGHTTSTSYSSAFVGAYPTQVTNALSQSVSRNYDFNTGLAVSSTDLNGLTTSYNYDPMWRLIQANRPDGGQTTTCYTDAGGTTCTQGPPPFSIVTTEKISSTTNLVSMQVVDGLARTKQTQLTSDPDCLSNDKTDTTYDPLGRVLTVSNPYCTTSDSTYGLTTYAYDALGRVTQVTNPDGSTVLSTYTGRATQVQDEGNGTQRVQRISQSDALGRLASVCEVSSTTLLGNGGAPAACPQDIAATGFLTTYQYDTLGNLLQVNQGTLAPRTFAYDSLSRLTSASNPESGTISYAYDANGNVLTKTGPKQNQTSAATTVTTTYQYDPLNRLLSKSYNDGTTPTATYIYDLTNYTNSIGRLSETTVAVPASVGGCIATFNQYDPMGRISYQWQFTPQAGCGNNYQFPYTYDLLGNMTSSKAPYQEAYTLTYNTAGRLTSMIGSRNDAFAPANLLSAIHYNAAGQITADTLGTGEGETYAYTNRNQLQSKTATLNSSTIYSFNLTFAPDGNILTSNDSVNGNWTYTYDPFNRLACSNLASNGTCSSPTNGTPSYTYDYDRYGNRWHQNGQNTMMLSFSGNNNRMDGYSYDAAGNLLSDGTTSYTYDAENRLISATNTQHGTATYLYDAAGRRVHRTGFFNDTCDGTGKRDYIYDLSGHWLVENNSGSTACNIEIYAGSRHLGSFYQGEAIFDHTDWVGTSRVRMDFHYMSPQSCTSLPFGDGLSCSTNSPIHFTGKERDSESGLDDFGARYFASTMGRFTSVDPIWVKIDRLVDPQRLNLYAYARNNPLTFLDLDGMDVTIGRCSIGTTQDCFNQLQAGLSKEDRDHVKLVTGDGKNGCANGVSCVVVDADYKSDSKNFQVLQTLANDHSATATVDVLKPNDSFDLKTVISWDKKTGDKMAIMSTTPGDPNKGTGFGGYTFFPYHSGDPGPFSPDDTTHVVANSVSDSLTATIHHELRHVFLGDFGRSAKKAGHGQPGVNRQTKAAEDEAKQNEKQN